MEHNLLYYGDNLNVMRLHVKDESVDLVYLDPPFNSGRNYNTMFKGDAQATAFTDTWSWDEKAVRAFEDVQKAGGKLADAMLAMKAFVGGGPTLAYLSMMAPRLQEIRRVLKPTGGVYLHCDPSASHYLKILMDAVFGVANFRNEVIWANNTASGFKSKTKNWVRGHDTILYYIKNTNPIFNRESFPYDARTIRRYDKLDQDGRKYKVYREGTRERRAYLDEAKGRSVSNVWTDITDFQTVNNTGERLGYPTQKPLALLDRIILASSNPGDVVLDAFCGCGTAIESAQNNGRRWIGIDITHLAVKVIKDRLDKKRAADLDAGKDPGPVYKVIGEPADLEGAKQLALEDTHQFEHWALGLVGARASAKGKGADRGIDGVLYFEEEGVTKAVPISVKSGGVTSGAVRDLRGVMERDKCPISLLITLHEPSKDMKKEALEAGFYEAAGMAELLGCENPPRIQILSVKDLFEGKRPRLPGGSRNVTLGK